VLLLAIPAVALAQDYKPSPVEYKKTTLKSDYMLYPANALIVGRVGENKGKLILACAAIDKIIILDPDTGKLIKEYGEGFPTDGALDDVAEGPTAPFTARISEVTRSAISGRTGRTAISR
jgi:hypothetical protein